MPIKSKAQQGLMYATAAGANTGVPKKVAKEYIAATPKKAYKALPEQASPVAKRQVALKRKPMGGGY